MDANISTNTIMIVYAGENDMLLQQIAGEK